MGIGIKIGFDIGSKLGTSPYGIELVPNGFTTGWTISGTGECSITDGVLNVLSTDGSYQGAFRANTVEVGKSYKVEFDSVATSGTARFRLGSGNPDLLYISATQHYSQIITNNGSDGIIYFERAAACNINISNISVKEVL